MTIEQTIHTFNTLSDLVRVVSKLKKAYPDIPVICMSQYTNLNKLTLGYTNDSLEIKDENILTIKEYERLENKENYITVLVLG